MRRVGILQNDREHHPNWPIQLTFIYHSMHRTSYPSYANIYPFSVFGETYVEFAINNFDEMTNDDKFLCLSPGLRCLLNMTHVSQSSKYITIKGII